MAFVAPGAAPSPARGLTVPRMGPGLARGRARWAA